MLFLISVDYIKLKDAIIDFYEQLKQLLVFF